MCQKRRKLTERRHCRRWRRSYLVQMMKHEVSVGQKLFDTCCFLSIINKTIINDMFCQGNSNGERKMVAFLVDCYFGAQGGRTETIFRYFGYLSICVVTECWWIACEIGL